MLVLALRSPVQFMRRSHLASFFFYWAPAFIWMVVIFSASADQNSFNHSSRLIGPLLHWLFPGMPEASGRAIIFVVRKIAHLTEYALLGVLLWRALRPVRLGERPEWSWRVARLVLMIAAVYAASDEIHQSFVPTRQGSPIDVLIDTTGAAVGLLLVRAICYRTHWQWKKTPLDDRRKE